MDGIGIGHWIFAGIFVVVFVSAMVYAYRKDLSKMHIHYKRVWTIILMALVIYFAIYFLNRLT